MIDYIVTRQTTTETEETFFVEAQNENHARQHLGLHEPWRVTETSTVWQTVEPRDPDVEPRNTDAEPTKSDVDPCTYDVEPGKEETWVEKNRASLDRDINAQRRNK